MAGANVKLAGRVTDAELRWLYTNCRALVAASHEDFGLTPLEAAGFGKPTAALRWGGFLDTVQEGDTGVFFDAPTPRTIGAGVRELLATSLERGGGDEFCGAVLRGALRRTTPGRCYRLRTRSRSEPLRPGNSHGRTLRLEKY